MDREVFLHDCVVQTALPQPAQTHSGDLASRLCSESIGKLLQRLARAPAADCPVFFGSGFGVLSSLHEFDRVSVAEGPLRVNPSRFPDTVLNAPACRASIQHHLTGPIYNLSNGRLSALDAIGLAMTQIAAGQADEAIVCAVEEASPVARRVDASLSVTGGAALFLSASKARFRLYGYRRERVKAMGGDAPAAGCVEPLLRLADALKRGFAREITLVARQGGYGCRIRLAPSELEEPA